MQKSLAQIKATSGRDITSQVDNNTLVYGETGSGTGGAFNFMAPINNALANQTSLKNKSDANSDANLAFPADDKTEFYNVSYSANNVPLNTCSWVIKATKRGNGIHQIAYSSEDTTKNYVYSRVGTYDGGNPTWGSWEQIATKSDLENYTIKKSDLTNPITVEYGKQYMIFVDCRGTESGGSCFIAQFYANGGNISWAYSWGGYSQNVITATISGNQITFNHSYGHQMHINIIELGKFY